jgi:hypothetical protein
MLAYGGQEHTLVSDFGDIASKCSVFGAPSGNIAPPVLVDGDVVVSQSIAVAQYVGEKLGLTKGLNHILATQFMIDIVDLFELGLGKSLKSGEDLHGFLQGGRFAKVAGAIEANIKGPFFFGDAPTCVDFFLTAHMEWSYTTVLTELEAKVPKSVFAELPKMAGVYAAVQAFPSYKEPPGFQKDLRVAKPKEELPNMYPADGAIDAYALLCAKP